MNCNSTSKGILVYVYSGMYNVYVKKRKIFIITKIVHMNEKIRLSSEKEKVKEFQSQSRRVAPPLDIHFGCWVGGVTCIIPLARSIMNLAAYVTRRTETASVCRPLKIATVTAHWLKSRALCVSTPLKPATASTTSVPTGSSAARRSRAETTPLG